MLAYQPPSTLHLQQSAPVTFERQPLGVLGQPAVERIMFVDQPLLLLDLLIAVLSTFAHPLLFLLRLRQFALVCLVHL